MATMAQPSSRCGGGGPCCPLRERRQVESRLMLGVLGCTRCWTVKLHWRCSRLLSKICRWRVETISSSVSLIRGSQTKLQPIECESHGRDFRSADHEKTRRPKCPLGRADGKESTCLRRPEATSCCEGASCAVFGEQPSRLRHAEAGVLMESAFRFELLLGVSQRVGLRNSGRGRIRRSERA